jgi:hypothetical protein
VLRFPAEIECCRGEPCHNTEPSVTFLGEDPLAGVSDAGNSGEECAMSAKYAVIGINHAELRRPDQRIGRIIECALGLAQRARTVDGPRCSRRAWTGSS